MVGGAGYSWRHGVIQAEIQNTPSLQDTQEIAAADSILSTTASDGTVSQPSQAVKVSPLGDVSGFRKITQDTLDLVNAGNLSGAQTRITDLESEWDTSQSRLKPMNTAKWTEVDGALDKVLRQLRAVHQDALGCKSSLEALLVTLN